MVVPAESDRPFDDCTSRGQLFQTLQKKKKYNLGLKEEKKSQIQT